MNLFKKILTRCTRIKVRPAKILEGNRNYFLHTITAQRMLLAQFYVLYCYVYQLTREQLGLPTPLPKGKVLKVLLFSHI